MLRQIPTDTAAHALPCKPAEIRELRSAWQLEGIGERVGKVTMYSRGEVALIAVAFFLRKCGLKTGPAFAIARAHARQIYAVAEANAAGDQTLLVRIDSTLAAGYAASIAAAGETHPESTGNAQAVIGLNLRRVTADVLARLGTSIAA